MRSGEDSKIPSRYDEDGHMIAGNTRNTVYAAMFLQVIRDYQVSDFRNLQSFEIRFLYDGLRAELKESTKPR